MNPMSAACLQRNKSKPRLIRLGAFMTALLAVVFCAPEVALAVVSEDALPSQAEWISAGSVSNGLQTAYFRRTFKEGDDLVKAVLLVACDQRMSLFINGQPAGDTAGFERAASLDVTRLVRPGTNLIAARVSHERGLPVFRLMLELATANGRQRWVVSDAAWQTSMIESPGWERPVFDAAKWTAATAHGELGTTRWGNSFAATKSVDAYNSWMLAKGGTRATDPSTISAPTGFRVDLLRSSEPTEDSWIALAFDPQGRLTVAREKKGLLRMTIGREAVEHVEVIEDTLLECRGLLYAYDSLYVNANNSRSFHRLRDTDGDGKFDEDKVLLQTDGGVGHGRNQLRLGPDGLIYLVHGDDVELSPQVSNRSAIKDLLADQLLPSLNGNPAKPKRKSAAFGHVLRTDRDGRYFEVIAAGLRNPMDVDFNADGELFTFDADNERYIGEPWYQPTRVLHVVKGGDYGWRQSPGNIPAYCPDTLPSVVDVGVGSPTGIEFGTRTHFPPPYREALFIADWSYGRILMVTLRNDGASYAGTNESFLSGRPLNVTDVTTGPDGALYFVTGGRGTLSGLYRVGYVGTNALASVAARRPPSSVESRALRRKLESLGGREDQLDFIWPNLNHPDGWIRYAARLALEAMPAKLWQDRALSESGTSSRLTPLLALARSGCPEIQTSVLAKLNETELAALSERQLLDALRAYEVSLLRSGVLESNLTSSVLRRLDAIYPASSRPVNHELCRLLSFLDSTNVVAKSCTLLASARTSEDLLHYLYQLHSVSNGWSPQHRQEFFQALHRADQEQGARDYYAQLRAIRRDLTATLAPAEQETLGELLPGKSQASIALAHDPIGRPVIREWQLSDFSPADLAGSRTRAAGGEAFRVAQCIACHRVGSEPGGVIGPDLAGVGARYGRRDLLDHVLHPSKAIDDKFRQTTLKLLDGTTVTGAIEQEDVHRLVLSIDLVVDERIEIQKKQIASRVLSEKSSMPEGLLSVLTRDEVLDLISFLATGTMVEKKSKERILTPEE